MRRHGFQKESKQPLPAPLAGTGIQRASLSLIQGVGFFCFRLIPESLNPFQPQMEPRKAYNVLLLLVLQGTLALGSPETITPGAIWPDDRGRHIQAHGGCVVFSAGTYFWFGEDRPPGLDPAMRYVSCYASRDLAHWAFRRRVLALGDPEHLGPRRIVERPKVYANARTGKYVMYFHADGPAPGQPGDYSLARVGVAVCDTID